MKPPLNLLQWQNKLDNPAQYFLDSSLEFGDGCHLVEIYVVALQFEFYKSDFWQKLQDQGIRLKQQCTYTDGVNLAYIYKLPTNFVSDFHLSYTKNRITKQIIMADFCVQHSIR
eukprot:TRINITY_DN3143_c0_g2_i6.p4 TRINITY_DN3143_c0_g2~~TRINITY_DN3143_c0_g2_i6.p4  ORF type:complete len:114 (-),score=2.44 TRINITY_DN3143_c0_g2_i6:139-480(-)